MSPLAPSEDPTEGSARVFLFLEGPSSPIFSKIADHLERFGHRCLRINLNIGDRIFWRRGKAYSYRGRPEAWPGFIDGFLQEHGVTDLVLLGEERPYHRVAITAAKHYGLQVFVVEMGYLRPDWLTLERDGMSSNSHFPADPDAILKAARGLPEPDWTRRFTQSFVAEAAYDLLYNLPNVFFWFLFPHYKRHALFHLWRNMQAGLPRLAGEKKRKAATDATIGTLSNGRTPFFVYPLQLQTDFQLRSHSPYNDQQEAIGEILGSFAVHAPPATRLVVKVHPLDNGLIGWKGWIARQAATLGIADRVLFLDGGDLARLLGPCRGVVTVNSTVGLHALQQRKPAKVLGSAIFDVVGLSDQQPLDAFWRAPSLPQDALTDAFFRLVAATIQERGNFYSAAGTDAGAEAIAGRLHRRTVNEPGAFVDPPPRSRPRKRDTRQI